MSCEVEMSPQLIINDDKMGYGVWNESEDIHLILTDDDYVFGEIIQILSTELTIETEEGEHMIISFDKIKSYL